MQFEKINIYRMTHIENIPHILKFGITNKSSSRANPHYKNIGDLNLISNRSLKRVQVSNGKVSEQSEMISLGDFIPFYFGVRMPMLYVIQNGGNFVEQATNPENIVYLVCNVKMIIEAQAFTVYFAEGHAVDNLSSFYDQNQILHIPDILDWEAIKATKWDGLENLDRKRKKQAELLIKEDIPANFIIGVGCFNKNAELKLIEMGVDPTIIKVVPKGYY